MDRKRNAAVTACFLAAILLILTVADLVDGDAEHFAAYRNWAELKTRMTVLLQRQEVNGVYLCEDDYLIRVFKPEAVDSAVVEEKMKLLEELVERYDAKVMLVPNADQVLRDKLPWQAQCYDQSELLELVKERIGEEALIDVYDALEDRGYDPIKQLVGYLLSGDPGYISSHLEARRKISQVDRSKILEVVIRNYMDKNL